MPKTTKIWPAYFHRAAMVGESFIGGHDVYTGNYLPPKKRKAAEKSKKQRK
uniref:Uncharacterized protein n=1 Tax=Magallana gigas TaxID=29159 RepID=K1PGZ6_MAGGI